MTFVCKIAKLNTKSPLRGAGAQKSGNFLRRPRGYLARISAKFQKTFFLMVDAQDSSAAGECCGEVSRSNRGSFLVGKSNAGGNRAKGRKPGRRKN
jgi:hypothetical protein